MSSEIEAKHPEIQIARDMLEDALERVEEIDGNALSLARLSLCVCADFMRAAFGPEELANSIELLQRREDIRQGAGRA